jgi:hypothetical protein
MGRREDGGLVINHKTPLRFAIFLLGRFCCPLHTSNSGQDPSVAFFSKIAYCFSYAGLDY